MRGFSLSRYNVLRYISSRNFVYYIIYNKEWRFHYAALLEYYNQNGSCNVPSSVVFECKLPDMGKNGQPYHYKGTDLRETLLQQFIFI